MGREGGNPKIHTLNKPCAGLFEEQLSGAPPSRRRGVEADHLEGNISYLGHSVNQKNVFSFFFCLDEKMKSIRYRKRKNINQNYYGLDLTCYFLS